MVVMVASCVVLPIRTSVGAAHSETGLAHVYILHLQPCALLKISSTLQVHIRGVQAF